MATQRKRVFVTAGHVAGAEHAGQGFELVGQCGAGAGGSGWQGVTGETRPVVFFDGLCYFGVFTVVTGVILAHAALQFGKLADHVGEQVGLGQARGTARQLHITAAQLGDLARQMFDTRAALELRAQLVVIHHAGQPGQARFKALLAVLVKEEARVRQACAQHTLVAAGDRRGIAGSQIRDQ